MLWVKAFHIISMVAWFSGLFYLPRLFVYHAMATDTIGIERFKVMEKKLYCYIMNPAAILTILLGLWLIGFNAKTYMHMVWLHMKLGLVALLIIYHHYLGRLRKKLLKNNNTHTARYYRIINEIPTFFLISIVILVVVKPFGLTS